MRYLHACIFALILACAVVPVGILHAQAPPPDGNPGLVPCGNEITIVENGDQICYVGECSLCHGQILAVNVLNILMVIAALFAALRFIYAGGLLLFFAVMPNALTRARKILVRTTLGFFMVLAAWLVVDLMMRALFAGDEVKYGPWNEFLCKDVVRDANGQVMQCVDVVEMLDLEGVVYPLHAAGPGYSPEDFVYDADLGTEILSNASYQEAYDRLQNPYECGHGGGFVSTA
jgi:hypothetical protein